MKLRYKISIWVALALAGSLLCGGSIWLWLAGICAGKFLIRLLLTIALAITVYILTYASSSEQYFGYSFLKQTDI